MTRGRIVRRWTGWVASTTPEKLVLCLKDVASGRESEATIRRKYVPNGDKALQGQTIVVVVKHLRVGSDEGLFTIYRLVPIRPISKRLLRELQRRIAKWNVESGGNGTEEVGDLKGQTPAAR